MIRALSLAACCFVLSGCATDAAKLTYSADTGYVAAAALAIGYEKSPIAKPEIVAQIKKYDAAAFTALSIVTTDVQSGSSSVTADEAAATAAVATLSGYLASQGIK